MPHASRPRLRASAALALGIYAIVLIAGSVFLHGSTCFRHAPSDCVVCACLASNASPADRSTPIRVDRTDAGAVEVQGSLCDGVSLPRSTGDRAPPVAS